MNTKVSLVQSCVFITLFIGQQRRENLLKLSAWSNAKLSGITIYNNTVLEF